MIDKKTVSQSQKFIRAAKEHGCDESEAAFDKKLGKLAKATPTEPEKPKKGKRGG